MSVEKNDLMGVGKRLPKNQNLTKIFKQAMINLFFIFYFFNWIFFSKIKEEETKSSNITKSFFFHSLYIYILQDYSYITL